MSDSWAMKPLSGHERTAVIPLTLMVGMMTSFMTHSSHFENSSVSLRESERDRWGGPLFAPRGPLFAVGTCSQEQWESCGVCVCVCEREREREREKERERDAGMCIYSAKIYFGII